MGVPVIVALDVDAEKKALGLVDRFYPKIKIFKVGSQLYTGCGPRIIEKIHKKGAAVFLDLKFHDIPNTVRKASEEATKLGVYMFNIHMQGGFEMARQAKEASLFIADKLRIERPLVLGVTVLTSLNKRDLSWLGIRRTIDNQIIHLCRLAKKAKLDGAISSAHEIRKIRREMGKKFVLVVPGIRLASDEKRDQKRIATPKKAIEDGADFIVIGRTLTASKHPKRTLKRILEEVQ